MFETYDDYRRAWDNSYTTTPSIPLNVDIELAAACNLKCPFCFLQNEKIKRASISLMPYDLAIKTINEASAIGVPAVKMNWRGESTIHPRFTEILFEAGARGFHDVIVNTNGVCKDSAIDGLMAATKVVLSIDSFDEKTYLLSRVGGNLSTAKKTFKTLLEKGHKGLFLRRVVTKENEKENYNDAAVGAFGEEGYKISEHFEFFRGDGKVAKPDAPRKFCGYPSQRIVVTTNGDCYPCCIDYGCTMPIGNTYKQTLKEIWEGHFITKLRDTLKSKDDTSWPTTCKNCTSWASYDCLQSEALKK